MKKRLLLATICTLLFTGISFAQPNIFDPNDTLVTYSSAKPPVIPPANTMAK